MIMYCQNIYLFQIVYTFNRGFAIRDNTDNMFIMNIVPNSVRGVMIYKKVLANNRVIDIYVLDNLYL